MSYKEYPTEYECPCCGLLVNLEYECPGYFERNGTVMVCSPPCGGAVEFSCRVCDWWYREPNNRGDQKTMGRRPEWLDKAVKKYLDFEEEDGEEEPFIAFTPLIVPFLNGERERDKVELEATRSVWSLETTYKMNGVVVCADDFYSAMRAFTGWGVFPCRDNGYIYEFNPDNVVDGSLAPIIEDPKYLLTTREENNG